MKGGKGGGVSNGGSFYRDQKYRRSRVGGGKDSKDKTGVSSSGQGRPPDRKSLVFGGNLCIGKFVQKATVWYKRL